MSPHSLTRQYKFFCYSSSRRPQKHFVYHGSAPKPNAVSNMPTQRSIITACYFMNITCIVPE